MKRRVFTVAAIVLVVAGLGSLGIWRISRSSATGNTPMQTATVARGSLVATVNSAGTIEAADAVDLTFEVAGKVKEVKVKEGDQVKAGQELASLDTATAELQVALAEVELESARADLEELQQGASAEEIAAAQASLASAEASLKALQAGPSADDIEIARLQYEQAKDSLWSAQCSRDATCGNPHSAKVDCDRAQASVASAEMSLEIARIKYEQAKQGATEQELRAAEAQVAQARLNLSQLTRGATSTEIRAAETKVKQAELNLQEAQTALAQCRLVAPFDGTIASLDLDVGQSVSLGAAVGTLIGASGLEVRSDLSEVDVAKVKVGQEVEVVLDALSDLTFTGRVIKVATTGTSSQGVVNYPVTIALEKSDPAIKVGMSANVAIIVDRRENVLLVPNRAIQVLGQQHVVRVLHEGQIIEVPVQVGLAGDNGTEILGDTLREGDTLVLNSTTGATTTSRVGGMGLGGVMIRP